MYDDSNSIIQAIENLKKPIEVLSDAFRTERMSYNKIKWDIENREAERKAIEDDIARLRMVQNTVKQETEFLRSKGQDEKNALVLEGIKFVAECQGLLEKGKKFYTAAEKREFMHLTNEAKTLKEKAA